jgi:hypothetical protein
MAETSASGYAHGGTHRANFQEMNYHFEHMCLRNKFEMQIMQFLHTILKSEDNEFILDRKYLRLWDNAGAYWCRPGEVKTYITSILMYRGMMFAYEQDTLDDTTGHFRLFSPTL